VVPDLEAGNMLAKNLTFLARGDAAGTVLGARLPIVLTSRADSVRTRMASCAVAVLYAHALREPSSSSMPDPCRAARQTSSRERTSTAQICFGLSELPRYTATEQTLCDGDFLSIAASTAGGQVRSRRMMNTQAV
jgi:hypothetical protein